MIDKGKNTEISYDINPRFGRDFWTISSQMTRWVEITDLQKNPENIIDGACEPKSVILSENMNQNNINT